MFEITSTDIAALNDAQLRNLVALLCEAELARLGHSTAAVTAGGSQDAADGGLDVRVSLPNETSIAGYIPRVATGFQVKCQDMAPTMVAAEMAPQGVIRPSIAALCGEGGAYIIISSRSSVADSALQRRKAAMRKAVEALPNANALALDFYDQTRIASWVRRHPGLILWVRSTIGKAFHGWEPYGGWAYPTGGVDGEYLTENGIKISPRPAVSEEALGTLQGIAAIRDKLQAPRSVVRLVGLSGVGKTRLVQALFDGRVGSDELDPSLAIYTNMNNGPDPQPISLASDLVATGQRAILIVDNCAPELHGCLSEVAKMPTSQISVITVEYDIRDDQPEHTDVFEIEVASIGLIEQLLSKRFPDISQLDAATASEFSGGNARIAIALAETVARGGTLERLTDDQLFKRLFVQRQEQDKQLLEIAQAFALIYSFDGEDIAEDGELFRLGGMVGASAQEAYRASVEMLRRDLAQKRGVWRAILPHALANRLAINALQNIPRERVLDSLVYGAPERIAKSFSRRLGYLHASLEAVGFVEGWFAESGWISDPWNLNEFGRALFTNLLPVAPEAGLAAMERSLPAVGPEAPLGLEGHLSRGLWSIAYDASLFERATELLRFIAAHGDESSAKAAGEAHTALFTIHLSGTHATVEQRVAVARRLSLSANAPDVALGLQALDALLQTSHFSSMYDFQFGARSRDYGYHPKINGDVWHWYRMGLKLAKELADSDTPISGSVRDVVATNFRGLLNIWALAEDLTQIARDFSAKAFWREGWKAVKSARVFDCKGDASPHLARLNAIEEILRPTGLVQLVRGKVFASNGGEFDTDELDWSSEDAYAKAVEKKTATAEALGVDVAADPAAFEALLQEFISGSGNLWQFGIGLAKGTAALPALWERVATQYGATPAGKRDHRGLCGILWQIAQQDRDFAQSLLDAALDDPRLAADFPSLQGACGVDEVGVARLLRAIEIGKVQAPQYGYLHFGWKDHPVSAASIAKFIAALAEIENGRSVALQTLNWKFFNDTKERLPIAKELIAVGHKILSDLRFVRGSHRDDHALGGVIKVCLATNEGYATAKNICESLLQSYEDRETYGMEHNALISALFKAQPFAALDVFFGGRRTRINVSMDMMRNSAYHQKNPLDEVSHQNFLEWANRDPPARYPALATAVSAFGINDEDNPSGWNPLASVLVRNAPDPIAVMAEFVKRFEPTMWSGSRASIIEANAKLLAAFDAGGNAALAAFIAENAAKLRKEAAESRVWETRRDRGRDESFE